MRIMHEAEMNGLNSSGIDVSPWIVPLMVEIESYPDLRFREEYISKLSELQEYYYRNR